MRTALAPPAGEKNAGREQVASVWRHRLSGVLTQLAIWLPLSIAAGHVVVFTLWTTWVSFTASTLMPDYAWVGLRNYYSVTRTANFQIAYVNLVIFGLGSAAYYMGASTILAVATLFPAYGQDHGFMATIPGSSGNHTICAYGINQGARANTLLGCATG